MLLSCVVAGRCGGCPWIHVPYPLQLDHKRGHFQSAWVQRGLPPETVENLAIISPGESGLRDRADLTLSYHAGAPVLGLWDLHHQEVVPVQGCPAVNPKLLPWIEVLAADPPSGISRASLRLRVGPAGEKGLWLDLANLDIKALLDQREWLQRRMGEGQVEIGQRRKPLRDDGLRLRLDKEVDLHPWSVTWLKGGKQVPCYGVVGGFSQVGVEANRHLVEQVLSRAEATGLNTWVELGCGSGNFTLPLASRGWEIVAADSDEIALAGLKRSLEEQGLSSQVKIHQVDMNRPANLDKLWQSGQGLLVDPPRSGLGGTLTTLAHTPSLPPFVLYLSCYQESLIADLAKLIHLGYAPDYVVGIDQFPQTPHCEWLVGLSIRKSPAMVG